MFERSEQKLDLAATASTVKDTMGKTVSHVKKINVFALAAAGILFVALLFAVIGLTGPMFSQTVEHGKAGVTDPKTPVKTKVMAFLYKGTLRMYNKDNDYVDTNFDRWCSRVSGKIESGDTVTKFCNKDADMWLAAYAFSIIGLVSIGVALATTLLVEVLPGRIPALAPPIFIILAWVALIISWAVAVSRYTSKPACLEGDEKDLFKAPSKTDPKFKIDYGLGLLITAWCLVTIALCVSVASKVMGGKGTTTATNQVQPAAPTQQAPTQQASDVVPSAAAKSEANEAQEIPSSAAN